MYIKLGLGIKILAAEEEDTYIVIPSKSTTSIPLQEKPFINTLDSQMILSLERSFFSLGHSTSGKFIQFTMGLLIINRRATVSMRQDCHIIRNKVANCRGTFIPGKCGQLYQTPEAEEGQRDLQTVPYEETSLSLLTLLDI